MYRAVDFDAPARPMARLSDASFLIDLGGAISTEVLKNDNSISMAGIMSVVALALPLHAFVSHGVQQARDEVRLSGSGRAWPDITSSHPPNCARSSRL